MKQMRDKKHAEIEATIAQHLFLRHNMVFLNGYVEDEYIPIEYVDEVRGGKDNWYKYRNRRANGITRVYIGSYGEKRMFRQKNDGSMRYDEIADELARRYRTIKERIVIRAKRQSKEQANKVILDRVAESYGIELKSWRAEPINIDTFTGKFSIKLVGMSEMQVRRMLDLALEMGLNIK